MHIRVAKKILEAHQKFFEAAPFEIDYDRLTWRDHQEINLADCSRETLDNLKALLQKTIDIRGSKTIIRDIDTWIKANSQADGIKLAKARTTRAGADLLVEFIRRSPHKHIYRRIQEGNEGVTLAYFVEKVTYYPRSERVAEHVIMACYFEEFGLVQDKTFYFQSSDCLGKTAPEILLQRELMLETPELRADHIEHVTKYGTVKDQIGTQYLAVGVADDHNIDGNDKERNGWWYSSRSAAVRLDANGSPSRVVIDIFREEPRDRNERDEQTGMWFWKSKANVTDEDWEPEDEDESQGVDDLPEVPIHPYVAAFDLKRHKRLRIHVGNLELYQYDRSIREHLVLPKRNLDLIDTLLVEKHSTFHDIIVGKSGGTIILCQGRPGTGKTLTAEVFAEFLGRALYTVQCSQLGTNPEDLESNLLKVLARGRRWEAVMLLDEADVYVHQRGNDLQQNAIVGVFLRVLEYHSGVLFLTTNRGDLVDDAILSRCTARIPYENPLPDEQVRIWKGLAKANQVSIPDETIRHIVEAHSDLSGRDIKNILKLAMMVARDRKCGVDEKIVAEVKQFKPTFTEKAA